MIIMSLLIIISVAATFIIGLAGILYLATSLWLLALNKFIQAKNLTEDFKEFWAEKHFDK